MKYSKPVILVSPMGNARERFECMRRGAPVPPRTGARAQLSDELREAFIDTLARKMAALYKQQVEEGKA